MISYHCPGCGSVPLRDPKFGDPGHKHEYKCPGCKGDYQLSALTRRSVTFPPKEAMTSTWMLPHRLTAAIFSYRPSYMITSIIPESERVITVAMSGYSETIKIKTPRMAMVFDLMMPGTKEHVHLFAVKNDEDNNVLIKPLIWTNTDPSGKICWGPNSAPRDPRQAEVFFWEQPFNSDHWINRSSVPWSFVGGLVNLKERPKGVFSWKGIDYCELCCMCQCHLCQCRGAGADPEEKWESPDEELFGQIIWRFRKYDPYADDPAADGGARWTPGNLMIYGQEWIVSPKGQADMVFASADPQVISSAPSKAVARRADGEKAVIAFGYTQTTTDGSSVLILDLAGTLCVWDGDQLHQIKKKRVRKQLERFHIVNPRLPGYSPKRSVPEKAKA